MKARSKSGDNVKRNFRTYEYYGVDWIHLGQDGNQWRVL